MGALFFQIQNFIAFLIELGCLLVLCRVIPGGSWKSAFFATLLYGFHPLAAETVNYALQRGMIFSAAGVFTGLFLWIVWPRMLPRDLILNAPRVPKTEWDLFRIRLRPRLSRGYRRLARLPVPWYLFPVLISMFAGPGAVAFVPVLIAYILVFEPDRLRGALPAVLLFGGTWIFQIWIVWSRGGFSRIPLLQFFSTQPWVVLHYFYSFFVPTGLSGVTTIRPAEYPWSPLAIAGCAGIVAMLLLGAFLGRSPRWRPVGFGLWWFLAALLPGALIPQHEVEAFPRMFIAYAGLAFAVARAAFILLDRVPEPSPSYMLSRTGAATLGAIVLVTCGWETYQRNEVWQTDETLWSDVVEKNPHDGRALMHYGLIYMDPATADPFGARYEIGFDNLKQAATMLPRDPELETNMGIACERIGLDRDAETHFRRALSLDPSYSPAYAALGDWLLAHQRSDEAFEAASKAAKLDSVDVTARRTLAEIYVEREDWAKALSVAEEARRIDPDDYNVQRAFRVAEAGVAGAESVKTRARAEPSVANFLALSVSYYQARRYQDCIEAAQEALKLRPGAVEAYVNIAAAWHAMGKEEETIAALREALRLKPDFALAKQNLDYELAHTQAAAEPR